MVLARGVSKPLSVVNAEIDESINGVLEDSTDITVAAVHFKPAEFREAWMERHSKMQFSDSRKTIDDWRQDVNLPRNYSTHQKISYK